MLCLLACTFAVPIIYVCAGKEYNTLARHRIIIIFDVIYGSPEGNSDGGGGRSAVDNA